MYDAINLGLEMARGTWIGFLNADDQLLEGALADVEAAAWHAPTVDIWYGDLLVITPDGQLLAWRKTIPPCWWLIAGTNLYVPSSAMCVRRERWGELRFCPEWRSAGDEELAVRLFKSVRRSRPVGRPLAVFTVTGRNLSRGDAAREETRRLKRTYPLWIQAGRPVWWGIRWMLKLVCGAWRPPRAIEYAVHTTSHAASRVRRVAASPQWRWPGV